MSSLNLEGVEDLPESIELDWPQRMKLAIINHFEDEGTVCSDNGCWFGNVEVTLDGAFPWLAVFDMNEGAGELAASMDFPLSLVSASDCTLFAVYPASVRIRIEGAVAQGVVEGQLECIVAPDEGPVLHDYFAEYRFDLSGSRL
jgi:hypothetical protein